MIISHILTTSSFVTKNVGTTVVWWCGQQWWNVVTQWDLCHVTSFDTLSPTSSISLLCCQNMDPDHQVDDMTWKLGKFIDV